jgi:NhaP-type Na+/H+ or K+/H+ antiporter
VLFTLLVQATTIGPLLRKLGLTGQSETEKEYERIHARLLAARAAYNRMKSQYATGALDPTAWSVIDEELQARIHKLSEEQKAFAEANPDLVARITSSLRKESLLIQRAHISDLEREGVITDDVARELIEEIDAALDELNHHPAPPNQPVLEELST